MEKRIYFISGATSGIGRVVAHEIARTGATVVFNARDMGRGESTRKDIVEQTGNRDVHAIEGDFASLRSVKNLAESFLRQFDRLDVLIHNAGTWEMEYKPTLDGIETNFGVNHLAPFLLNQLLLPSLLKSSSARIIVTSSMAHRRNVLQLDDLEFKRQPYNGFFTYSQSKLCNLLFARQLRKKLIANKIDTIAVNSLHPGVVRTALFDKMSDEQLKLFGGFVTTEEGAETTLYLALSSKVEGVTGGYWFKDKLIDCTDMAKDDQLASKLWALSEGYISKVLPDLILN